MESTQEMSFSSLPIKVQNDLLFRHNKNFNTVIGIQNRMLEINKEKIEKLTQENAELKQILNDVVGKNLSDAQIKTVKNTIRQWGENYTAAKEFIMSEQLYGKFRDWKQSNFNKKNKK